MYKYDKHEIGKNGTINPNYYRDKAPFSNKMAMEHIEDMMSVPNTNGFFRGQIMRYDIRAGSKDQAIQDIHKIITYGYLWIKFLKRVKGAKDNG